MIQFVEKYGHKIQNVCVLVMVICGILLYCTACSKSFCVKVDGSYQGKQGSVEYCYSPGDSNLIAKPVFTSSDGKKAILLDATQFEQVQNATPEAKIAIKKVLGGK